MSSVGENRETDEKHDEDCFEEVFQLASAKFDRNGVREAGGSEALGVCIVVSIFEMDKNWSYLNPRKAVHVLKTIFQYFYYLVV